MPSFAPRSSRPSLPTFHLLFPVSFCRAVGDAPSVGRSDLHPRLSRLRSGDSALYYLTLGALQLNTTHTQASSTGAKREHASQTRSDGSRLPLQSQLTRFLVWAIKSRSLDRSKEKVTDTSLDPAGIQILACKRPQISWLYFCDPSVRLLQGGKHSTDVV